VIPLYKHARKLSKKSGLTLSGLKANTIELFSKRDLIVIATFAILGIGGALAATLITVTAPDSQGAGYLAATSCDESITVNKDVVFNSSTKRFEITTISISNVNQSYDATGRNGCGNQVLEMAFPINGSTTYASWTIPSSTITNGIFSFGGATGITYNAYTALTPVDAQSLATVALMIKPATRAVNNGPVYDLLKDNGFTTTGQSGASSTITFALSLSCGVLTVDTTAPGVSTALAALTAPTGYVKNDATSTGANGATTAALLGYRGSVANINIILPWISYNKTAGTACTSLPALQGAIWEAQPAGASSPIAWNFSENGHYYQYVEAATTWLLALNAITGSDNPANSNTRALSACNYQILGLCGYFATIQTAAENAFITDKVGTAGAWLGGYDYDGVNLQFKWTDPVAPEYNAIFTQKVPGVYCCANTNTAGSYTTSAPSYVNNVGETFSYSNWNTERTGVNGGTRNWNQPDYYGSYETYLQIISGGSGKWNDLGSTNLGYIVEYGGSRAANESLTGGGSKTSSITWHW
jgi:hypothetical protein